MQFYVVFMSSRCNLLTCEKRKEEEEEEEVSLRCACKVDVYTATVDHRGGTPTAAAAAAVTSAIGFFSTLFDIGIALCVLEVLADVLC